MTLNLFFKLVRCCAQSFSPIGFFVTQWTVACQALLSMGFSRHEYWSGLPFPPPGDLPDPGIEPGSPELQVDSLPTELRGKQVEGVKRGQPYRPHSPWEPWCTLGSSKEQRKE